MKSVRMVEETDGPAVEILSTKPLVPAILPLDNPPRLVIDLPQARLDLRQKRTKVQAHQITTLRADQFKENPPVARVVVDLIAQRSYTWEAAGNRLVIHLGKDPTAAKSTPVEPATVPSMKSAPHAVATVATQVTGTMALIGEGILSGTSVTAGGDTAMVKLGRGGDLHVCPGTTLSVTPSQNHRNVMLSLNTGAFELHYALDASSDSVVTPDFRILLTGPGDFHYALSADNRGNTCVRSLPGNTASAIVSELMGDRTYQVKATDQLVFRSGRLDQVDMNVPLECGCPPPRPSVLRASGEVPVQKDTPAAIHVNLGTQSVSQPAIASTQPPTSMPASSSPAVAENKEIQVKVEAPMVFRGGDAPPAQVEQAQALPADSRARQSLPSVPLPSPVVTPATPANGPASPPPHRGFFKRLGGFFASMFR